MKEDRLASKAQEIRELQAVECTFQPALYSSYYRELQEKKKKSKAQSNHLAAASHEQQFAGNSAMHINELVHSSEPSFQYYNSSNREFPVRTESVEERQERMKRALYIDTNFM